jgi:hypothetical protein
MKAGINIWRALRDIKDVHPAWACVSCFLFSLHALVSVVCCAFASQAGVGGGMKAGTNTRH